MKVFHIKKYEPKLQSEWDSFVTKAKNSTFLFLRDFMGYHSDRFTDYSLLIYKKDKLVGLLPANKVDNTLYSHQGLSYGGLLLEGKTNFEDIVNIYRQLLQYIETKDFKNLIIKSLPLIYHKTLNFESDYLYERLNAQVVKNDSYYVIEAPSSYNPNRNRKRAIKVAKKQSMIVNEQGDLSYFWKHILSVNLSNRFNVSPVHTIEEIELLKSRFPEHIKFYSVENNGRMHAGVLVFVTDDVLHFQYSSGNDERSENGALDLLFHTIIEKYNYKKYISFGSSTAKNSKINKGLAYWKESFGAKLIPHKTYKILVENRGILDTVFND